MKIPILSPLSVFLLSLLFTACGPDINPDPPPAQSAFCLPDNSNTNTNMTGMTCKCPEIPGTIYLNKVNCDGGRILRATLVCAGPQKSILVSIGNSRPDQPSLGTTRYSIQFLNGSRFQGSLISADPGCWVTDGTDIDFTFGAVYTSDQGEETVNGSVRQCIRQSKVDFSNFNFDTVGNFIHEGKMKQELHDAIDKEIIKMIYPSSTGRCQNWRMLP